MTTIRFSASGFAAGVTSSFTVQLGGTPSVGDQVVVWLGLTNEIVTHQPNFNLPTQWSQIGALRSRNTSTLSAYQHTWAGTDSGSTATFSVSPSPTLGIGDKDLSSVNILWAAVVLQGPTAVSEKTVQGSYDVAPTLVKPKLHKAASVALVTSYGQGVTSFSDSDSNSTVVTSIEDTTQCLSVFSKPAPVVGYSSTITAQVAGALTANPNFTSGTANWTVFAGTFTTSSAVVYALSTISGLLTPDGVSAQNFIESNLAPVLPNTNYTATGRLLSPTGHTAAMSINWFDSGQVYITTTSGSATTIGTNTWTVVQTTGTSPSNAAYGQAVPIQYFTPAVTDLLYITEAYLFLSSAPGFPRPTDILMHVSTFNDNPTFLYNPGIIAEGPVSEDALLYRYTLDRYYTLFNNSGVFTMSRYSTTDDLSAATQVFTNNSPVSSTDRTNILNSGAGGEFISA